MNILDTVTEGLLDRKFFACRSMIAPSNVTDKVNISFAPDTCCCGLTIAQKIPKGPDRALAIQPDFIVPIEDGSFPDEASFCESGEDMLELRIPGSKHILYHSIDVLYAHFEIMNWDDEIGILAKWVFKQLERRKWEPKIKRDTYGIAKHRIINSIGLDVTFPDGTIKIIASGSNEPQTFDLNYPNSLAVFEKYLDSMSSATPMVYQCSNIK